MNKRFIILIGCLLLIVITAQSHVIGMWIIFEHGWQRNQTILLTAGFALLLAIVVCLYRRRERRRQITGFQCSEDTLQMERQVEELRKITQQQQQELELLQRSLASLRLRYFESTSSYQLLRVLERRRAEQKSLEAPVVSPAEREVLFHLLDELFDDFMKGLKEECPLLTRDDLLFCCLVSLHLPLSTIALCFGYSDANVLRQRKYRMKDRILKSSGGLEAWERLFGEVKD